MLAIAYLALGVAFSNLAPENGTGVAMGLFSAVLFFGLGVGPMLFGGIMNGAGYVAGFTACAVTAIVISIAELLVRAYEPALRRRPAVVLPPPSPGT
jgi:MFS family permease